MPDQTTEHPTSHLDALAGLIGDWITTAHETARDILDAGWRPPARVITTIEELNALPIGAIVLETGWAGWDSATVPCVHLRVEADGDGARWLDFGDDGDYDSSLVDLPVLVLWQQKVRTDA